MTCVASAHDTVVSRESHQTGSIPIQAITDGYHDIKPLLMTIKMQTNTDFQNDAITDGYYGYKKTHN